MKTGEKLCTLRKKEGWSQGEFANKLNISRQTVSKWELNESLPDAENLIKISELLKVSTDYLLKEDLNTECVEQCHPKTNKLKNNYNMLSAFLFVCSGILILGVLNSLANIKYHMVFTQPFIPYVDNHGLQWLVVLSAVFIVIGICCLLKEIISKRVKKRKEYKK